MTTNNTLREEKLLIDVLNVVEHVVSEMFNPTQS